MEVSNSIHPQLIAYLRQAVDFTDQDLALVQDVLAPQMRSFKKGEFFCRPGQEKLEIGFVLSGIFKVYYLGENGEVYIKRFVAENELLGPYQASILAVPSNLAIEAIEPCQILAMDAVKCRSLFSEGSHWQELGRKIAEYYMCQVEAREYSQAVEGAEQRYLRFQKTCPGYEARIPQKDIAHYLSISPVSLSRIRSKMKPS